MIIVVDTREKLPWKFSPRVQIVRKKLDSGDYSILDFEDRVSIERKTKNDFVSSICKQRARFNRELKRLQSFEYAAVVVEAELHEILSGDFVSGMDPKSVLATVASISIEFGIPVFFGGHRAACCAYAEAIFERYLAKKGRK